MTYCLTSGITRPCRWRSPPCGGRPARAPHPRPLSCSRRFRLCSFRAPERCSHLARWFSGPGSPSRPCGQFHSHLFQFCSRHCSAAPLHPLDRCSRPAWGSEGPTDLLSALLWHVSLGVSSSAGVCVGPVTTDFPERAEPCPRDQHRRGPGPRQSRDQWSPPQPTGGRGADGGARSPGRVRVPCAPGKTGGVRPTLPTPCPDPTTDSSSLWAGDRSVPEFPCERELGPEETQAVHKGNPDTLGRCCPRRAQFPPCARHAVPSLRPVCHGRAAPPCTPGPGASLSALVPPAVRGRRDASPESPVFRPHPQPYGRHGPPGKVRLTSALWRPLRKAQRCSGYRRAWAGPSGDRTRYSATKSAPDPRARQLVETGAGCASSPSRPHAVLLPFRVSLSSSLCGGDLAAPRGTGLGGGVPTCSGKDADAEGLPWWCFC